MANITRYGFAKTASTGRCRDDIEWIANTVRLATLVEPTPLSILPPAERARIVASHEVIVAAAEADGPEAGVHALLASVGEETCNKLDVNTQAKRLLALASSAPMVGPHARGLLDLMLTEADVRGDPML